MCTIFTPAELHYRSPAELQALYRKTRQELAMSAPGTEARRKARASLENISFAISRHRRYPPPCP